MKYNKRRVTSNESQVFRIIDVNVNRAVEGLRVMEEVARFILQDKKATLELKKMRSTVRGFVSKIIENEFHFQQRKALRDIGRRLYTSKEAKRETVLDIFMANAKRVQEALRVLEEFLKLAKPVQGKLIKNIRFKVYDLEKNLFHRLARRLKLDFDLYVITDPMKDHLKVVRQAIAGGVKIIQLRDKSSPKKKVLKLARQIMKMTQKAGVTLIINDYLDIAKQVGADGVHLGQEDLRRTSLSRARRYLGEDKIVGVSTHSFVQAAKAAKSGADYMAVGPIFATPTKPGKKAVGLKLLKKVVRQANLPVVAIGGINKANLRRVLKTGCSRVAVIRAILNQKNIKKAVKSFRKDLSRGF